MNKPLLFFLLLLFASCTSKRAKLYTESAIEDWHTIDLGSFKLETPQKFRFKQKQGIDSFVGEITNGKITFFFDYGWYSSQHPMTPIEAFRKQGPFDAISNTIEDALKKQGLETPDMQKVFEQMVVKEVRTKSVGDCTDCDYMAIIEYAQKTIEVPFIEGRYDLKEHQQLFHIETSQQDSIFRKIYWPRDLKENSTAGIYFEELKVKDFDTNKLFFRTLDCTSQNLELIKKILNTVQLKE